MKLGLALLVLVFLEASAKAQVELGPISMAGTACRLDDVGPIPATIENGLLQVPVAISLKKAPGEALKRGTCQFAIPVQVGAGQRLVLSQAVALGSVNLSKGTQAKVAIELFKAGSHGNIMTHESIAIEKKIKDQFQLSQEGEVIRLACGEATILRGNASILLRGDKRATSNLHLVEMEATVEDCE
jgi:hypothetical protein